MFSALSNSNQVSDERNERKVKRLETIRSGRLKQPEVITRFKSLSRFPPGYAEQVTKLLYSSNEFNQSCLKKMEEIHFDFFYRITTRGKAVDIYWFPESVKAECVKKHILELQFPKPESIYNGYWNIADKLNV